MIEPKVKAQLLLSWLGPAGSRILAHLSPESSHVLTSGVDNLPTISDDEKRQILAEVSQRIQGASGRGVAPVETGESLWETPVSLGESDAGADMPEASADADIFEADVNLGGESLSDGIGESVEMPKATNGGDSESAPEDYRRIADALAKQRPQVVAFVLSRLDETMKASVQRHIPAELLKEAQSKPLELVPMSEKVYQRIFDAIIKNN